MKNTQAILILFGFLLMMSCGKPAPAEEDPGTKPVDTIETEKTLSKSELLEQQEATDLLDLVNAYDAPERSDWQNPGLVINMLGDISDKTVADIGFGSGYFSRRLAQKAKKVIAVEVDERWIEYMDSVKVLELSEEFQERLDIRLATPKDSKLKDGEADIILIVNTYCWFLERVKYLNHLKSKLAPGGKIFIVDFKRKRLPPIQEIPKARFRVPLYQVENEFQQAGFTNIASDDKSLDYQYIVVGSN